MRMGLDRIAGPAGHVFRGTAVALGASIPVSTALDNVLIVVAWAAAALSGQLRDYVKLLFKIKYLQFCLLLFGLLALGTFYGDNSARDAFSTLGKYADLLCIPVFAIAFRERDTRMRALYAFAITIAAVVVLSYLLRFGLLPQWPVFTGNTASPTVFKLKITHNIFVAFGAFLFAWLGSTSENPRVQLTWFTLSLLAALNVLLLVQGATGYLTLGVLILLLGRERIGRRGTIYAVLALATVVAVLVSTPNAFRDRVLVIAQEVQQWRAQGVSTTSAGSRLEFYANTLDIVAAHPLSGVGTGGFPNAYARQVRGSGKVETRNPHNEFLHIAAQIGIIGLVVLMVMYWQQWRSAKFLASPMEQALARGLVLTMVSGCMVNSLLLDHAEGLFYAWLSGLLLGGLKYGMLYPPTNPLALK